VPEDLTGEFTAELILEPLRFRTKTKKTTFTIR